VAKYRHPVITSRHLERMEQVMRDVCFGAGLRHYICIRHGPPSPRKQRQLRPAAGRRPSPT